MTCPIRPSTRDTLRLVVAALAATACAAATAQVSTTPLEVRDAPPVTSPSTGRQTGIVTFGEPGGQQVIVRSYEPDAALRDNYRIDFEALDTDADGFISRREAAAHPTLDAEFRAVDANGDGRLSREELAGWLR
ncbi:EF-hand domain-containing protein [Luteimonas sp. BDR2-5]|uniref:EF-hand domain-containing protein n=1 Tax=Proluteimonas luteida TaxID=2878685 RepID=UPI001E5B9B06|nr:EF-hand domain-containing protein [Luteimonas sp. BDR2-5]MCD9028842.1 EF-hand domain-containing protein [Luteimonas sp. BDR2-5]